jgi:hypothetical protein
MQQTNLFDYLAMAPKFNPNNLKSRKIIAVQTCPKCEQTITDLHADELHTAQGCIECENDGWLLLPTDDAGLAILAQYPETPKYVSDMNAEWKRPWYATVYSI